MNVRRGLFRLWVVAAVLWVLFVVWLVGLDTVLALKEMHEIAPAMVGPPAAVLALGAALVWAFSGFSRR